MVLRQRSFLVVACLMLLLLGGRRSESYYLPGVNPQNFAPGDPVKLKVNKMTSSKALLPIEYYQLPFCRPDGGPKMDNENLGEFLAGDRIESSPFVLIMKEDFYCAQLCISNVGRYEQSPSKMVRLIRKNYHNNWIVDNLSSASKVEDDRTVMTRYWQGFPIGFVNEYDGKAYIHNHVNIQLEYHPVEGLKDVFRIVRFTVQPFSIKHEYDEDVDLPEDEEEKRYSRNQSHDTPKSATIKNPIASCVPGSTDHTTYDMVTAAGRQPQEASGKVLFTYDVIWTQNDKLKWASRWDIYLSMDNAVPAQIHWNSIGISLCFVLVLTAILVHNLRQDLQRYNRVETDEETEDELEEYGLKLVHADVFRPPSFAPLVLSVFCGTGVQILLTSLFTIIFSAFGYLSPANRGSLVMAEFLLFVLMGSVNGYVTARLYKTFQGETCQRATVFAALGFPGLTFGFFFIMDLIAWGCRSSYAVPFITMLVVIFLWIGVSTPLVFLGAWVGYKADAVEFPVETSKTPREIPSQPWFLEIQFTMVVSGLPLFGVCFVELYFILNSLWIGQYYYVFGLLFLVYIILVIACAEVTVIGTYLQLRHENYHWWWRSFCMAGSGALFVFLYSCVYFKQLEANTFAAFILYFGYMSWICFGLFLMLGTVGFLSSFVFNMMMYRQLKLDLME